MKMQFCRIVLVVFVFAVVFLSCTDIPELKFPSYEEVLESAGSSGSKGVVSSASELKNYCVYLDIQQCYSGYYSVCPGVGGVLSNTCPYNNSSSSIASSSSLGVGGSSSSQSGQSSSSNISSSSALPEYGYCVFISDQMCLTGPMSSCPPGSSLSNSCPYGSSSSATVSSSSTMPSSSSLVPSSSSRASSSSVAQSSSSATPSSSSIVLSSSSLVPSSSSRASSSSVAPSSSSLVPSSSSRASSSSATPSSSSVATRGTFTDSRDNTVYEWVKIGMQTWMAENLNYNASNSKCYNDYTSNCTTYGRLYSWATAMDLDTTCNSSICASKRKGICPDGWHIPSNTDWNTLMKSVNPGCSDNSNCADAGTKLKATSGWNSYSSVPVGTDDYGFSALPGGYGLSNGSFGGVGNSGIWWSASEYEASGAYIREMSYLREYVGSLNSYKDALRSVRCLQD